MEINDSRLIQVTLKFRLEGDVNKEGGGVERKVVEKEVPLLFPKRVDNYFYILNGNRYYAIYQIVDKGAYAISSALSLKTLLMPLILHQKPIADAVSQDELVTISGSATYLEVFKNKINILFYFLAEMGWDKCMEFIGLKDHILVNEEPEDLDGWDEFIYSKNTVWIKNWKDHERTLLCSVLDLFKGAKLKEFSVERDYWVTQLGKIYTTTAAQYKTKGEKILVSLTRILDNRTKKNLTHVADKDKENIFHLIRWMAVFYKELHAQDTVDLKSKRLRLMEYLIYPLLRKLSDETYRILNSRRVMLHHLESVFSNISPKFVIDKLVTNKLLRYTNAVNRIDLFSSALKVTQSG